MRRLCKNIILACICSAWQYSATCSLFANWIRASQLSMQRVFQTCVRVYATCMQWTATCHAIYGVVTTFASCFIDMNDLLQQLQHWCAQLIARHQWAAECSWQTNPLPQPLLVGRQSPHTCHTVGSAASSHAWKWPVCKFSQQQLILMQPRTK